MRRLVTSQRLGSPPSAIASWHPVVGWVSRKDTASVFAMDGVARGRGPPPLSSGIRVVDTRRLVARPQACGAQRCISGAPSGACPVSAGEASLVGWLAHQHLRPAPMRTAAPWRRRSSGGGPPSSGDEILAAGSRADSLRAARRQSRRQRGGTMAVESRGRHLRQLERALPVAQLLT
jgi:hypothetical protein